MNLRLSLVIYYRVNSSICVLIDPVKFSTNKMRWEAPVQSLRVRFRRAVIASVTTIITDVGRAEGVGDAWGRGCAGVRRRAPREHPVLR